MSTPSVLIVGAGLSGLITALSLIQNGVSVRIIEKSSKYNVAQKGTGIQPRTLDLYDILGTYPEFAKIAGEPHIMRIYELPGGTVPSKTFGRTVRVEPTSGFPHPNAKALGQAQHEAVIRDALEKRGVTVELGTELLSFTQDAAGVTAVISKPSVGQEMTTFKFLVGADGAHSVVRKQLGIDFLGETKEDHKLVLGDIFINNPPADLEVIYRHCWGEMSDKGFHLLPAVSEKGLFTFYAGGKNLDYDTVSSSREELIKSFYEITDRRDIEFGELVWMGIWRANIRMAKDFGRERVYIVGDAAHAHSPTGGQGFNSGIQDSVNLAWKLALVVKGLAPLRLLKTYSEERLPVIAMMLEKTTELLKVAMTAPKGTGMVRGHELKQLGVTYRGSSIVRDDRSSDDPVDPYRSGDDGRQCAGDRAPDASGLVELGSGKIFKLFNIFSLAHHTVLIFPPALAWPLRDVLSSIEVPFKTVVVLPEGTTEAPAVASAADYVVKDTEGSATQNYKACSEGVVIIRPDGVIGAKVASVEEIKSYFLGITGA